MQTYQTSPNVTTTSPMTDELVFLRQHTGKDEQSILIHALQLGLDTLYRQTIEELFINEKLPREQAEAMLGARRVREIQYARQALAQDITRGLQL